MSAMLLFFCVSVGLIRRSGTCWVPRDPWSQGETSVHHDLQYNVHCLFNSACTVYLPVTEKPFKSD